MRIFVNAKPGAREDAVQKLDDVHYVVSVKEPPVRGLANAAIVKLLTDYFRVAPACVRIIAGGTSRQKIVEVKDGCVSGE